MGYFSNGSEGDYFESLYCSKCVHENGPDGKSGCAVMLAHILHAYSECDSKSPAEEILTILIPRDEENCTNAKCTMFHAGTPAEEPAQLPAKFPPHLQEWAKKQGLV